MARQDDGEEATAARDFVMARLLAAGVALKDAAASLDELCRLFVVVEDDSTGKKRAALLEEVDAACGEAVASVQVAMSEFQNVNPEEGEEEPEDDDEEEEEEAAPTPRRGRRR